MTDVRHALIFTGDMTGGDPVLKNILEHLKIKPVFPQDLAGHSISVVVIERPGQQAIKIIQNLRKQNGFARVPILVILEPSDRALASEFSVLQTDVLFKPVAFPALRRYLETKLTARPVERPAPPPTAKPANNYVTNPKPAGTTDERTVVVKTEAKKEPPKPAPPAPKPPPPPVAKKPEPKHEPKPAPKPPEPAKPAVRVLEDVIPVSARMMPSEVKPLSTIKGGVPCPSCKRLKARKEDPVCSRCGFDLVSLDAPAEAVVFEPAGEHKTGLLVEFRNAGINPLVLAFRVVAPEQLARHFSHHTDRAVLAGNTAEQLRVVLDASGLDLTTRHQAQLEVTTNENGLSKRYIPLVVERLPKPRVYAVGSAYGYALGGENFWEFGMANDGGGTLRLKSIRVEASKELPEGARLEPLETIAVRGTQTTQVRVRVPELKLGVGRQVLEVVWEFHNYTPVTLRVPVEFMRPPRLVVQQTELDFGVVSTTRSKRLFITLTNTGGEDLQVEAITPHAGWVKVIPKTPLPLTLHEMQSDTVEIEVRGTEAPEGQQRGELVITSNAFLTPKHTVALTTKLVHPEPYEEFIGIDFGTTASCVAVLDAEYNPFLLSIDPADHGDARIMPSVLYFNQDGSVLAGRSALERAVINPANAVTSIKRALGLRQTKAYAGREYDATAITSKIIAQLMERAEDGLFRLGDYKTPRQAIVTVPIEFNNSQRRALLEACRVAGLDMPDTSQHGVVIDEAHAAALYYLSRKAAQEEISDAPEKVLIFDFGGGTLDCALVEIERVGEKMVLRTLAPGGNPRLGGEDIDWALVGLLADKAKRAFPTFDVNCLGDEGKFDHIYRAPDVMIAAYRTRSSFKREAEAAKIALTQIPKVEFKISPLFKIDATAFEPYIMNGAGLASFDVQLTREELEGVIEPFLVASERVVATLCERARVRPDEVDTILHVGRTSKLPLVRERIKAMLPNAVDQSHLVEPKVCVALGAAFWGYIKDNPGANFEFVGVGNQLIHDLGFIALESLHEVFRPVFTARTEYPCERVINFPRRDFINIRLAENRGKNARVRDNAEISRIGNVRIDARGAGGDEIPVVFRINDNQILEIIANEQRQAIELD